MVSVRSGEGLTYGACGGHGLWVTEPVHELAEVNEARVSVDEAKQGQQLCFLCVGLAQRLAVDVHGSLLQQYAAHQTEIAQRLYG